MFVGLLGLACASLLTRTPTASAAQKVASATLTFEWAGFRTIQVGATVNVPTGGSWQLEYGPMTSYGTTWPVTVTRTS